VANEFVVDQSTSKWCKWHRDSYAVGALARFNNNADLPHPWPRTWPSSLAQEGLLQSLHEHRGPAVEAAHVVETSNPDDRLSPDQGPKQEKVKVNPRPVSQRCVEAPRGIPVPRV